MVKQGPVMGFAGARWVPSPNFRPRKADETLQAIILHGTWMDKDDDVLSRLTDAAAQVSAHYYITRQGEVIQLVDEIHVAWHAGRSSYPGLAAEAESLNGISLGIELANKGPFATPPAAGTECLPDDSPLWQKAEPYTEAQYEALGHLLDDILSRHSISPDHILGHSEVSPGRKSDPGPHFNKARVLLNLGE
jgi:N-acetylmuramoyl-L-alanine amidase